MGTSVRTYLAEAGSLRELARLLGLAHLGCEQPTPGDVLAAVPAAAAPMAALERAVIAVPAELWARAAATADYGVLLSAPGFERALARLDPTPELTPIAVLRGLCRSELRRWYERTGEAVELRRGDPCPLPCRPRPRSIAAATPNPVRRTGDPLEQTGFHLVEALAGLRLVLDYSARDDLDAATWRLAEQGGGDVAPIATVHPLASAAELSAPDEVTPGWWFGVRPRRWDADAVLDQLRRVADAGCAVLPELALPEPGALAALLAEHHTACPPLVVAGSAHDRCPHPEDPARSLRVNESRAYLHGAPLLRHRKVVCFETRHIGDGEPLPEPLPEGLTSETKTLTVAAGTTTHLAVAICADLNGEIAPLLRTLGVNLLLVPALTPHDGAFNGVLALLATHCQGVSVVANGAPPATPPKPGEDPAVRPEPFLVMAAVPRLDPREQTATYPAPAHGRRATGVFDPSRPLADAMRWRPE